MLLEAETVGFGASGRNGGFCAASLTHGLANGSRASPTRCGRSSGSARENLDGLDADLEQPRHRLRLRAHGRPDGRARAAPGRVARRGGASCCAATATSRAARRARPLRAEVASPTYRGAVWDRTGTAMRRPRQARRRPARRRAAPPACASTSTRRATALEGDGPRDRRAPARARRAPAACCSPRAPSRRCVRALRRYIAPVYDYALVTEPLSAAQRDAIGWRRAPGHRRQRQPVPLLPADRRRPDPVGRLRRRLPLPRPGRPAPGPARRDVRPRSRSTSSPPSRSSRACASRHRWGGAIDTCSRFSSSSGPPHGGARRLRRRLHRPRRRRHALGRRASRSTCSTGARPRRRGCATCAAARSRSRPSRCARAVIQLTRNRLAAADLAEGRRGLWLRTLDRLGLGFDS